MYIYIYIYNNIYYAIYIYIYIYTCRDMYVYTHTSITCYISLSTYLSIYVSLSLYVCIYIYIQCIYIYIHRERERERYQHSSTLMAAHGSRALVWSRRRRSPLPPKGDGAARGRRSATGCARRSHEKHNIFRDPCVGRATPLSHARELETPTSSDREGELEDTVTSFGR